MEESGHGVRHSVDVTQTVVGESDTGKGGAQHHGTGSIGIVAACDELADVAADELHSLLTHCHGEGVGIGVDVGFHGVDQSVNAAGSSHGSGSGHDELGIQNGIGGRNLGAQDGQLVVTSFVGDNSGHGDLGAGTSGGGHSDQGVDGAGHLADAFIVTDGAAELSNNAHSLGNVHGGAAAQSDDGGAASSLVLCGTLIHDGGGGVGQNIQVLAVLQVGTLDDLTDFVHNTDGFQATVGDQHNIVGTGSFQEVRQLLQRAHTELAVLRDDETKIFNHRESHPFQVTQMCLYGLTTKNG